MQHSNQMSLDTETQAKVPSNVELTPQELKVLRLLAQGLSIREIANQLKVNQRTIECGHIYHMRQKTGLNNSTELAHWAIESKLLEV